VEDEGGVGARQSVLVELHSKQSVSRQCHLSSPTERQGCRAALFSAHTAARSCSILCSLAAPSPASA
jgi:hypothetical protein